MIDEGHHPSCRRGKYMCSVLLTFFIFINVKMFTVHVIKRFPEIPYDEKKIES